MQQVWLLTAALEREPAGPDILQGAESGLRTSTLRRPLLRSHLPRSMQVASGVSGLFDTGEEGADMVVIHFAH